MKKIIGLVITFALVLLINICNAAAFTQEDLAIQGVNLVTGHLEDVIGKFGTPEKTKVYDTEQPPMKYLTYQGLQVWINHQSGQIIYMKIDGNDYQTARGVKVGGTSYKVIKEYGEPQKQHLRGHLYFVYKMDAASPYRLLFDMTDGYVSKIILSSQPDNP